MVTMSYTPTAETGMSDVTYAIDVEKEGSNNIS